jgi:GNAT superfamily N-acetyltransferase
VGIATYSGSARSIITVETSELSLSLEFGGDVTALRSGDCHSEEVKSRSSGMEISIRLAKAADLKTIIDLQTNSLSNLPAHFRKYDRQQIDSLISGQATVRKIYFLGETTLIAEDKDRIPIGFISFCQPYLFAQPQIAGLFVHPDFMNKGVGSRLLKELELLAIEKRMKMLVVMSSMESIDFYKKHRYEFKRETGFCSPGAVWIPCELLEKELIPPTKIDKLANQSVKIALAVVFLSIVATIAHKPIKQPICCPSTSCSDCPQPILHSQKYYN